MTAHYEILRSRRGKWRVLRDGVRVSVYFDLLCEALECWRVLRNDDRQRDAA